MARHKRAFLLGYLCLLGTSGFSLAIPMVLRAGVNRLEHGGDTRMFVLQDYYQRPTNYRSVFADYLPHLDALINSIYWTPAYPRLVTRKWVKATRALKTVYFPLFFM